MFVILTVAALLGAIFLYTFTRLVNAALPVTHGCLTQVEGACKILRDLTEQTRRYNDTMTKTKSSQTTSHPTRDSTVQQELRFLRASLRDLETEKTVVTSWSKSQADEYNKNISQLVSALHNSQTYNDQLTSLIEALEQHRKSPDKLSSQYDHVDHEARRRLSRIEADMSHKADGHQDFSCQLAAQARKISNLDADYTAAEKCLRDLESHRNQDTKKSMEKSQLQLALQIKLEASKEQQRKLSESLTRYRDRLKATQKSNNVAIDSVRQDIAYLKSDNDQLRVRLEASHMDLSDLKQELKSLNRTAMADLCSAFSAYTLTSPKPPAQDATANIAFECMTTPLPQTPVHIPAALEKPQSVTKAEVPPPREWSLDFGSPVESFCERQDSASAKFSPDLKIRQDCTNTMGTSDLRHQLKFFGPRAKGGKKLSVKKRSTIRGFASGDLTFETRSSLNPVSSPIPFLPEELFRDRELKESSNLSQGNESLSGLATAASCVDDSGMNSFPTTEIAPVVGTKQEQESDVSMDLNSSTTFEGSPGLVKCTFIPPNQGEVGHDLQRPETAAPDSPVKEAHAAPLEDVVMMEYGRDTSRDGHSLGDNTSQAGHQAHDAEDALGKPGPVHASKQVSPKPPSDRSQRTMHGHRLDTPQASPSNSSSEPSSSFSIKVSSPLPIVVNREGLANVEYGDMPPSVEQQQRPSLRKPRGKVSKYSPEELAKMKSDAAKAPEFTHYSSAYLEGLRDYMLDAEILVTLDEIAEDDDEFIAQLRSQDESISERELIDLSDETRHALDPYTREMLYGAMEMFCERYVWAAVETIHEYSEDMDPEKVREVYMENVEIYLDNHPADSWNAGALQMQAAWEME